MVLNGIYFSKDLITKIYFLISLAEQNSTERMVNVSPLKNINEHKKFDLSPRLFQSLWQ